MYRVDHEHDSTQYTLITLPFFSEILPNFQKTYLRPKLRLLKILGSSRFISMWAWVQATPSQLCSARVLTYSTCPCISIVHRRQGGWNGSRPRVRPRPWAMSLDRRCPAARTNLPWKCLLPPPTLGSRCPGARSTPWRGWCSCPPRSLHRTWLCRAAPCSSLPSRPAARLHGA